MIPGVTTLADLRASSLDRLEELFRAAPIGPPPHRRLHGEVLCRVDSRLARSREGAAVLLPFQRLPFGVDFASRTWFFVDPRLRTGHFRLEQQRSRWRDTEVLALHYDVSRLPRRIRDRLYDEIKPLADDLWLGLGGLNAPVGDGDLFFFALYPAAG